MILMISLVFNAVLCAACGALAATLRERAAPVPVSEPPKQPKTAGDLLAEEMEKIMAYTGED